MSNRKYKLYRKVDAPAGEVIIFIPFESKSDASAVDKVRTRLEEGHFPPGRYWVVDEDKVPIWGALVTQPDPTRGPVVKARSMPWRGMT